MSDETTLLFCPFCGEEPWEPTPKRWTNAIGDELWSAFVHCPECEITVKTECVYETPEAAIEAAARKWNTRTHGTLTAEQVSKATYAHSIHADCADADWQAIADELNDMLGSDNEYEAKMDELLCYLTNGKFSKSRQYSLDFMKACVDEEYEDAYNELNAELGSGTCEFELNTDMTAIRCDKCGYELPKGTDLKATRFCGGCGKAVKR